MSVLPRSQLRSEKMIDGQTPLPPRRWRHKFGDAFRGLKLGIRGHSSFSVHFFFTVLVIAGAVVLGCTLEQWCLLLGAIGMVLLASGTVLAQSPGGFSGSFNPGLGGAPTFGGTSSSVPEIDPGFLTGAIGLLSTGVLMLRGGCRWK